MKFYRSMLLSLYFTCWLTTIAWTQSRVVSGVSTDPGCSVMPRVTIQVKGTTSGTVSDSERKYAVNVDRTNAVVVFSFIGLATQEIQVGSQSVIGIMINEDASQMQEAVVTALGVSREAKTLVYVSQQPLHAAKRQFPVYCGCNRLLPITRHSFLI